MTGGPNRDFSNANPGTTRVSVTFACFSLPVGFLDVTLADEGGSDSSSLAGALLPTDTL